MGQIILTVKGSTVGERAVTFDFSTEDTARILAMFSAKYGIALSGADSIAEIWRTWTKNTIDQTLAEVRAYEQHLAARAASEAVAGIVAGMT